MLLPATTNKHLLIGLALASADRPEGLYRDHGPLVG